MIRTVQITDTQQAQGPLIVRKGQRATVNTGTEENPHYVSGKLISIERKK